MSESLNQDERDKFARWLEEDAVTDRALVDQMLKIGTPEFVIKERHLDAEAKFRVANILRGTETVEA